MAVSLHEVVRNPLKDKLRRGEVASSMIVRLARGIEIAQIAATAGFDSFYVDLEHSGISIETASQICLAALPLGLAPMVRVPANTPDYISRLLDGGAMGVIAPHVDTAEEAARVVAYAKFAPLGERSVNSGLPQLQYRSFPAPHASQALNDATMVVVQAETARAVENADAIAATPGVDMILIGSNDLLADLGLAGQYDHPALRQAFERVIAATARHGVFAGIGGLAGQPRLTAEFVKMGARYVSTGTDLSFLLAAATAKAKEISDLV